MPGDQQRDELAETAALRRQLDLLAETLAGQVEDLQKVGAATTGQGKMLADLAAKVASFMGTTRATLELLSERVDDLARRIGALPPDDHPERRN